jgi:hypothetical protein
MDRDELIRLFVLDAICDDYENVDQVILKDVAGYCAKLGVAVDRSDVVKALAELVEGGMAKAYLLSPTEPTEELEGMPTIDVVETYFKTYFYITKKGMERHLSDDGWPFDGQGNPRA